jgi:hypothetical protein
MELKKHTCGLKNSQMYPKVKVKEFLMGDGIGAQIWRKVYAMSYSRYHGLVFENTPITDFLVHESDNVYSNQEKQEVIDNFSLLIYNPWQGLDFSNQNEYSLSPGIGAGMPESQGINHDKYFISSATAFNKIKEIDNSIVIHIRRGNVIKENPRWIDDSVYVNIFKDLNSIVQKFNMVDPDVIILTDAPDEDKYYTPIDEYQKSLWNQPHLNKESDGSYITKSFNFDLLRTHYPSLKVINQLNTYDSFLLMLKAKVLIVSRSAFSQSAGMLSHNNVFEMFGCQNGFKNATGFIDENGQISFYK